MPKDKGNIVGLTAQDEADLAKLLTEEAPVESHSILQVWLAVLKPAADELVKRVTPQWASRMVATYAELGFAEMNEFRDRYFGKFLQLIEVLEMEIATDEDCLTYTEPAEDAEHNSQHYKNLLREWQLTFLAWELDWDTTAPYAGVELAAISEVHKAVFGDTGITAFLDNIPFEFTDADQAELGQALREYTASVEEVR